jgi:hypothetical protein
VGVLSPRPRFKSYLCIQFFLIFIVNRIISKFGPINLKIGVETYFSLTRIQKKIKGKDVLGDDVLLVH